MNPRDKTTKLADEQQFILSNMRDFVYRHDADGIFFYLSPSVEKITGYTVEEWKRHYTAYMTDSEINEKVVEYTEEALRTGESLPPYLVEIYHKNGTHIILEVSEIPYSEDGRVAGIVGVARDVTDRIKREEIVAQSEKMMSIGGLAAGMAHEINNPLAGILQNTQVVLSRLTGDLPANDRTAAECGATMAAIRLFAEKRGLVESLNSVRECGERASKIVDNMLGFSRKSGSALVPHDVNELLDKTLELAANDYDLKKVFDFHRIEIVREYDPNLPKVPCAHTKIQQVLLNLIKNAIHAIAAAQDRGDAPRIVLRTSVDGNMAVVEVEDNGLGMDKETRKRVFEPFFTTKDVGGGTGLGLSVAYFIVTENHGGAMTVESEWGKGTTFTMRLPLEDVQ